MQMLGKLSKGNWIVRWSFKMAKKIVCCGRRT